MSDFEMLAFLLNTAVSVVFVVEYSDEDLAWFHKLSDLRALDRVNAELSQSVSLTAELKAITGRIVGVKESR